jgi:hypothetical protein
LVQRKLFANRKLLWCVRKKIVRIRKFCKMLNQRTAEHNIGKLHAATNRQHRQVEL